MATPAVARIDPREYEEYRSLVDEFQLAPHSTAARALVQIDPARPVRADLRAWPAIKEELATYATFHRALPFVVAPPGTLDTGWLRIATQVADRQPITLHSSEVARNVLILGSSGSGKTSAVLTIADAVLDAGYDVWFFDVKRDAPRLALRHDRVLVLHADAPVDLLAKPTYLTLAEHITTIIEPLARATYGGQTQRAIAHEVFTRLFAEHEHPTLHDAIDVLRKLPRKGDTYDRLTAIRNLCAKLQRCVERYPGLATRGGIPAHELCNHALLFPYVTIGDIEEFLTAYLVTHLFHHHRAKNIRTFRTLIAFEESLLLFRGEGGTSRISGNAVAELVGLTREFGTGWAISANAAHLLDPGIISNVFAVIALNASGGTEAEFVGRICGFSKQQLDYYRLRLTQGQAIVRLNDRHRAPTVATLTPWPHEKTVTAAEWASICQRTDALVPAPTHSPDTGPTVPVRVDGAQQPSPPRTVALNANERALLDYIIAHEPVLISEIMRDRNVHPQAATRALNKLKSLQFVESGRVRVGRGRGKTGVAIIATDAGAQHANARRSTQSRGQTSLQHRFLASRIARAVHGHLELSLNGSTADITLTFDSKDHERLVEAIKNLTAREIAPNAGDVLAIEVEVSDPARTAARNVARNNAAGVTLTIVATLQPLALNDPDTVVVDALALLEHLGAS